MRLSLRGRKPVAIPQTARTDCFVVSLLAMTLLLRVGSFATA
jgi:hypothetical protein